MDRNPPGFSVHGDPPGKNTGVHCYALLPGNLPDPGIKPRSPALQEDSSPSEPSEKLMNTGMGSLSFLQGIFPTQKSNWGLLSFRWILYQLSYQGSPELHLLTLKPEFHVIFRCHQTVSRFLSAI